MKIVIIGSVAAGTSAAAKARRNDESAQIVVYEKGTDISYSVCGLPYYIGREDISRDNLTPRNSKWFKDRFNIDIHTGCEVMQINAAEQSIEVKNLEEGTVFTDTYDYLVLATGSTPRGLSIPGAAGDNCFYLKTVVDADRIKEFITKHNPKKALVIGAGFIGLEMADNLASTGMSVSILEAANQVMPGMDSDITMYIEDYLEKKGVELNLGDKAVEIVQDGTEVNTEQGRKLEADLIIIACGVVPNTSLAQQAGVEVLQNGAIKVNEKMQTSNPSIYAVGDCAASYSLITGDTIYVPLGSTANKMGRIAGDVLTGGSRSFRGILGTGIFKIFDLTVGRTGLTEKEAVAKGFEVETIINIKENQSKYLAESREMIIKAVVDRAGGRLLGVQIVGEQGVDKRIDVFATAISFGSKAEDLFHLDLAYAPPFATTKDPVLYTGMVLDNALHTNRKVLDVKKLVENRSSYTVIDVRSEKDFNKGHIEGALHIPLKKLRSQAAGLDKEKKLVVHCNKGVTGNAAQNLLLNVGFEEVYNLSGGFKHYKMYTEAKKRRT